MKKILPCRFKQSFGPFNMLTVHKRSDAELFWVFKYFRSLQSIISQSNNVPGSSFFAKYCKFYVDLGNAEKKLEHLF